LPGARVNSSSHLGSLVTELPVLILRLRGRNGIFQPFGVIDIIVVCSSCLGSSLDLYMAEIEEPAGHGLISDVQLLYVSSSIFSPF
jgi:hypothetical protein